jgi:hypothetical protein
MKMAQIVSKLLCTLAICAGLSSRAAEIVYDNSTDFSGVDYETTTEYGDEVILEPGTGRAITEIQLEYYAQFPVHGDELGRVRFYKNTGPIWMGNPDYRIPESPPLFEQTFPLGQDYQTAVITVPSIVVPEKFTWTVQFLGISQNGETDRAGLLFYGVPTIGSSYDDFWELTTTDGWAPVQRTDVPKNNFGVRILAAQADNPIRLTITRVGNSILLTWPDIAANYRLESKTDLNQASWTLVSQSPTRNGSRYELALPVGAGNQFFRLRLP